MDDEGKARETRCGRRLARLSDRRFAAWDRPQLLGRRLTAWTAGNQAGPRRIPDPAVSFAGDPKLPASFGTSEGIGTALSKCQVLSVTLHDSGKDHHVWESKVQGGLAWAKVRRLIVPSGDLA